MNYHQCKMRIENYILLCINKMEKEEIGYRKWKVLSWSVVGLGKTLLETSLTSKEFYTTDHSDVENLFKQLAKDSLDAMMASKEGSEFINASTFYMVYKLILDQFEEMKNV